MLPSNFALRLPVALIALIAAFLIHAGAGVGGGAPPPPPRFVVPYRSA
jgi:hypothetical protein